MSILVVFEELWGNFLSLTKIPDTAGAAIFSRVFGQSFLGNDEFISRIKAEHLPQSNKDRERPAISPVHGSVRREIIIAALEKGLQRTFTEICAYRSTDRQIAMDLLYRLGGLKNREIGERTNLDYSTISQGRKRLNEKKQKDLGLKGEIESIEKLCQG
ncbi:MAG: hypothetical protein KJ950_06365 [Proteobacteria bacterium]|nr:hypothetical protein [Pseudomonadota bacterium]MBU1687156.1 hypothetical protein [Pseudomonadota bacterium]